MTAPKSVNSQATCLLERLPFAWLRERDVDLLLCSELHAETCVTRFVASRLGVRGDCLGAWVSLGELEGESDLVIAWGAPSRLHLALVENKIAASFQPDQAGRYLARANRWRSESNVASVCTVLIAPADYMTREGANLFDARITYEELAECARAEGDRRSKFLADALFGGVEAYRRGYSPEPNDQVSAVWEAIWHAAQGTAPRLNMQRPQWKPGQSFWVYFRDADGVAEIGWRKAVVVLKAERGQADLQFRSTTSVELMERCADLLDSDMKVVVASKSASIRIPVPPVDFRADPSSQSEAIATALKACERLRILLVEHASKLLPQSAAIEASESLELSVGRWFGWTMLPGYGDEPYHSPIRVDGIVRHGSDPSRFDLHFYNLGYASGVRSMSYQLRSVSITSDQIVALALTDESPNGRSVIIDELTPEWMIRNIPMSRPILRDLFDAEGHPIEEKLKQHLG